MNEEQLKGILRASIKAVAPELDPETLDPDADLREEVDLDSMDFLNFVRSLHEQLGIEIPEADYRQLTTLAGAQAYLLRRLARA